MSVEQREHIRLPHTDAADAICQSPRVGLPMLSADYSTSSQTVSELSAIGAPTRPLWIALGAVYTVLMIGFGWGVWMSAGPNRPLRIVGILLIIHAVFAVVWPPMHQRSVLGAGDGTLTDTLHIVWGLVVVLFMMAEVAFGAAAFGRRFRLYSIATVVVLIGCGVVIGMKAPGVQMNVPTPWIGIWQRINISAYMFWVAALAIATLRSRIVASTVRRQGIEERGYVRLGGLDQWVMIRGENRSNPPLIILHGGPGFSDTSFFRYFNARLEKAFTVVYWDQRGTGRSFTRDIPKSSMTVEQFIADLDQLVEWVRGRLAADRVVLLGHSWGSVLGVLYAARFHAKVALYVGVAQIGDSAAAESSSYAGALAEAQRRGHVKALQALRAIGPPPYSAQSVFKERTWWQRLDGQLTPRALWKVARIALGAPDSSIFDLPNTVRGFRFSMEAMFPEVSTLNLLTLVPTLRMPVFFLLGRRDHWVPPDTSVSYFDKLKAPLKRLVWFERSGHEPFVDEPAKFNRVMVDMVRPLVSGVHQTERSALA